MTNSWHVSGTVTGCGVKGTKYPILWVQLQINPIQEVYKENTNIFINFKFDADSSKKSHKRAMYLKDQMLKGTFMCTYDMMVSNVRRSKKEGDEWVNWDEIGYNGKISNIAISDRRIPDLNEGVVSGYVKSHAGTKLLVADRYKSPADNIWKEREIPVMGPVPGDLTGKKVVVLGKVCGRTPTGDTKSFIYSDNIITLDE